MTDPATAVLPGLLGLLPDRLPGKARLGRMALRPFLANVCDVDVIKIDVEEPSSLCFKGRPGCSRRGENPLPCSNLPIGRKHGSQVNRLAMRSVRFLPTAIACFISYQGSPAGNELLEPRCTGTAMLLGLPEHMRLPARR